MAQENNIGRLLPISENNGIQAVSGRYLHSFLQSKQDFSTWIKNRIKQYGFVENQDYQVFHQIVKNQSFAPQNYGAKRGGSNKVEYALSIDMAKELSMVERTERGRQARRYFIECEQALKKQKMLPKEQIEKNEKMMKESDRKIKMLESRCKRLENMLHQQEARTSAAIEIKLQESDLKNSCFYFLVTKNLYDEWQDFHLELVQKRIFTKDEKERKKRLAAISPLPF